MKIYTKRGDKGETSLLGGKRVGKCCLEMEAIGETDELNSLLGMLIEEIREHFGKEAKKLLAVQKCLFIIGAQLASVQMPGNSYKVGKLKSYLPDMPDGKSWQAGKVGELESWIDEMEKELSPLKNFIIPGGSEEAALSFYVRAVCRRAERRVIELSKKHAIDPVVKQYLNRLSDLLFVLGRWFNKKNGQKESPLLVGEG